MSRNDRSRDLEASAKLFLPDQFPLSSIHDHPAQLDVWTPTYLEASMGTDPWQPDTDNDGLTDGHEQFGIPLSRGISKAS